MASFKKSTGERIMLVEADPVDLDELLGASIDVSAPPLVVLGHFPPGYHASRAAHPSQRSTRN